MSSVIVPPRMAAAIWRQNLCRALLQLAHQLGEQQKPFTVQVAREYVAFKAQLDGFPQSVVAAETDRAFRWLRARKILVPDGDGYKVAPIEYLRTALHHAGDAPAQVGGETKA